MSKTKETPPGLKISDFEDKSLLIVDDDDPGPEQQPKRRQGTEHAEFASISGQLNRQPPPDHVESLHHHSPPLSVCS